MGYEGSVIDGNLMSELGQYARSAPLPLWVVSRLRKNYMALGLYGRIASAAFAKDSDKMEVTINKEWADELFGEGGGLVEPMAKIMEIGAITKVAEYRKVGKIRLRMEAYPPEVREELDGYRRPNGKLVAAFV